MATSNILLGIGLILFVVPNSVVRRLGISWWLWDRVINRRYDGASSLLDILMI